MSSEKNGKNLEYLSMEESQEVMVKGNAHEKGRSGRKPPGHGGRSWFRRRTTLERCLCLLLLVLVIICIVLLICLIVKTVSSLSKVNGNTKGGLSTEGVCTTPKCVIAAGKVLSNMDLTVDPCQDFFQFACGGWHRSNFIPDDEAKYTVFDEIFNRLMELSREMLEEKSTNDTEAVFKAKEFYASCTNEERINQNGTQPLLHLLQYLGGWPVIDGDSWNEEAWVLLDILARTRMELNDNFLFQHNVRPDILNSDRYIVVIDQPMLSIDDRSFYLRDKTDKKLAAYLKYMIDMATELRPDHNRNEAQRQMEEVLEFERNIANFTASKVERRDFMKLLNHYSVTRLKTEMPQVDWLKYFQLIHTTDFSPDEEIMNYSPGYFIKMVQLLNVTPKRTIANYLMWRVVDFVNEYLDTPIRSIRQQFLRVVQGEKREPSRWRTCFKTTNTMFGMAMGVLFIKEHFSDESKAEALEMLEDIRESLIDTLNEVPWMDEQTKALAIRKASKIKKKIGYDDTLMDDQAVNDVYKPVEISPTKYFENVRAIWKAFAEEGISKYGKPVKEDIWKDSPIDINAYYRNQPNEITFPAGIFQPPFYSPLFPKSMNYGGIGVVMGHELMHGFDDRGSRFDENGNIHQWFSNSSMKAYEARKKCFIDQFSNYRVPEIGMNLKGEITQGEVLADNGGIKEAYLAYKKWVERNGNAGGTLPGLDLNHDQLFFLNFAQLWCSLNRREMLEIIVQVHPHPPERFRVLGTLSNSEYFAEAYQCKKGSNMVRDEPCRLW